MHYLTCSVGPCALKARKSPPAAQMPTPGSGLPPEGLWGWCLYFGGTWRPPAAPPSYEPRLWSPKTQSQVQRNTALQEEAEPPRRPDLRPSPAQEGRPDALLPFARGRVCAAYRRYFKCKLWASSALQRAERCARNGVEGRCLGMYQLACWKGIHVLLIPQRGLSAAHREKKGRRDQDICTRPGIYESPMRSICTGH